MPSAVWTMLAAAFAPDRRALTLGTCCVCAGAALVLSRQTTRRLRMSAADTNLHLGSAHIRRRHVLETTADSFAFGGVRPIVDEHAVVAPRRAVSRASALSDAEWLDLWRCVRRAQAGAEARRGSVASNLLMTDGTEHIHVHVVPRLAEPPDFPKNDMVFDAMQSWAPTDELAAAMVRPKLVVPPDEARRDRTDAQMAEEAATYRARLGGAAAPDGFVFGRFPIKSEHIFYATPSTVAFVNLRPLVPGHVLVTPRRSTPRTADLSADEFDDLVLTARRVAAVVEATHPGTAGCELGVQDGKIAGQSVPHVHVHLLPRK